jgi:hypothetical protein
MPVSLEYRAPLQNPIRLEPYGMPPVAGVQPYVYPVVTPTITNSGAGGGLVSDNIIPGPILP